jgi:GWxTD domain-containing protein
MKFLTVIFLSLLIILPGVAQVEFSESKKANLNKSGYYQDFLNFASNEHGKSRLDVFIQVPYSQVQFLKAEDGGFIAKYFVTVSIFDENKDQLIQEKTWNESVETKDFSLTDSKNNYNLSLKSFYLIPAKYVIRTAVEDNDSRKEYSSENKFTVRNLEKRPAVSDIMLISKWTEEKGNKKIIPNVSRNVSAQQTGLQYFFEVYMIKPEKVNLIYTIEDNDENVLMTDSETKNLDSGKTQIFHTLNDTDFSLGGYILNVVINDSSNNKIASVSKTFFSRWIGIPSSVKDLDLAIAEMVYIASPDELDKIKDAKSKKEKLKKYLEYWKQKDPTPTTDDNPVLDEYYRRVSYANEKFTHYVAGWRTDRGMVYIILGPPNNVDRHPYEIDSKPYEIWQYYTLNRSFTFLDDTGFGDYRLITPLYGDDYRYRY